MIYRNISTKFICICSIRKHYKIFNSIPVQGSSKVVCRVINNFISQNYVSTCCNLNNKVEVQQTPDYTQNNYKDYIDRILKSAAVSSSFTDIVHFLKSLRIQSFMKTTNFESISNDARFNTLCRRFEASCHALPPSMLISGLRSFLEIGVPSSSNLINDIELVVMSRIKDFSMTELIGCLHLHNKFFATDRQKQVIKLLVQEIEGRIDEIESEPQVIMLLEVLHLFGNHTKKQIQDKIIELLPTVKSKGLIKMICSLAENAKRNRSLLNTVGYQLRQNAEKPPLRETVDILYALKILNYLNPNVLTYLTHNRETEISKVQQSSIISGLLNVCGQLKWRDSGLLDACGSWILQHIDSCSSKELVSYLLTTATLNYTSKENSVINSIKECLNVNDVPKDIWLDVVWSLAVLNSLDKDLLVNVLSPEFYSSLLEEDSSNSISNKLKLLNLKSILKMQYPEFVFKCDLFLEAPIIQRSQEDEKSKTFVIETLGLFVPNNKYMCTNINSEMGITIDAEFIMQNKGKPLLLSDYGLMSKPTTAAKALPPDAKRVALMIWLYKDYTLHEQTLNGVNALAVRLLNNLGYVVVEIPYGVFIKSATLVKKVMFLSETIKNAIKNKDVIAKNKK